jgi:hypothetical protein
MDRVRVKIAEDGEEDAQRNEEVSLRDGNRLRLKNH